MDIEVEYKVTNLEAILPQIYARMMPRLVEVVQAQVDLYLQDLAKHMGLIAGSTDYTSGSLHWEALDEETLAESPKFWYDTGKAKHSLSVNIQVNENMIHAFAGIAENAPGYQEALWNELGFTPRNGDTIVRRPLFFPLAEEHLFQLHEQIRQALAAQTIELEI